MSNKTTEEALQRFRMNKKEWEVYGYLGMGINYPAIEDFWIKELELAEQRGIQKGKEEERERIRVEFSKWIPYLVEGGNNHIAIKDNTPYLKDFEGFLKHRFEQGVLSAQEIEDFEALTQKQDK